MDQGVSNDVLAERIEGVRQDVSQLAEEARRTRTRLHQLEGVTGTLVDSYKQRRRDEQRRERALSRRLNVLSVVIAAAALSEPFLYHLATGK